MRFLVFFSLFIYVYCEITVFIMVANSIGVLLALIGIIATSVIGFSLVKSQGLRNLSIMQQKVANQQNPANEIVKSVALLLAGLLLLIPGFVTDILGAILLIPLVQQHVVKSIVSKLPIRSSFTSSTNYYQSEDIIEGEFKRKDDE